MILSNSTKPFLRMWKSLPFKFSFPSSLLFSESTLTDCIMVESQAHPISSAEVVVQICKKLKDHASLKKTSLYVCFFLKYFCHWSHPHTPGLFLSQLTIAGRGPSISGTDRTLSSQCSTQSPGNPSFPLLSALASFAYSFNQSNHYQVYGISSVSIAALIKVIEENPSISFDSVQYVQVS